MLHLLKRRQRRPSQTLTSARKPLNKRKDRELKSARSTSPTTKTDRRVSAATRRSVAPTRACLLSTGNWKTSIIKVTHQVSYTGRSQMTCNNTLIKLFITFCIQIVKWRQSLYGSTLICCTSLTMHRTWPKCRSKISPCQCLKVLNASQIYWRRAIDHK